MYRNVTLQSMDNQCVLIKNRKYGAEMVPWAQLLDSEPNDRSSFPEPNGRGKNRPPFLRQGFSV